MCGITAYKGSGDAAGILFEALRKLEYRGYDSAGIAILDDKISVRKGVGKVRAVDKKVRFAEMKGSTGIAHTRWATNGSVTKANAHPHVSSDGNLAVVQNGIVENYQELKKTLSRNGYKFVSDTDTEVILHLVEQGRKDSDLLHAVQNTFKNLHGRNAFVVLDESGRIIAAKKGSPLILGIAKDGIFLASDASPLLEHTRDIIFIEDNEIVVIDDGYTFYDARTLTEKQKEITQIDWTLDQAQKGQYDHYMLKEIVEQQHTISDALAQDKELILRVAEEINNAFGTYVVACGSAGKAALVSTYIFSTIAKKHLNFAIGSEFPNYHDFLTDKSLLIAISQSGETADTLEAIEVAKEKEGKVISVLNVLGSTMDRIANYTIPVNSGPEKAVCSTKAITGQMAIMYLLAYACVGKYEEGLIILREAAEKIREMLSPQFLEKTRDVAEAIKHQDNMYIIGRGQNYPMAIESAIKIQEVSYIHAEGFAAGELKHGPIALIDKGTPLIVLVANDGTKEDTISNAIEVKARGGFIIGIAPEDNEAFDEWIQVPDLPETSPLANIIPVQLLAYYLAVLRGTDVDMPRNLAKSVTVK